MVTVVACAFFVLLVRPISIVMVRIELFARALTLLMCRAKWRESYNCARLACSKWQEEAMANESVLFRFVTHYV